MTALTLALSKGRILEDSTPLLTAVGIAPAGDASRLLRLPTQDANVELLVIRPTDVPTEITYQSAYPTVGYAPALVNLGGALGAACVPSSTTACLIDSVLANNGNPAGSGKSGYSFTTGTCTVAGGVNVGYTVLAKPITVNQTGIRAFCAMEDAIVRVDPLGACSNTEAGVQTFNPLNQ